MELPNLNERNASAALSMSESSLTRLGRSVAQVGMPDKGKESGIRLLPNAPEAFATRVLLARAAQKTLDIQYYIWRDDATGTLLFNVLLEAAERGVRVRLLLDDNNTKGLDARLAGLNAHGNIEIRLFNPSLSRDFRTWGFLTDFSRANRRMHNKTFTADNQATIVGGRNVGDEYFGHSNESSFSDLDVLAIGPIVRKVSNDFDRYWASNSSYPVGDIIPVTLAEDPQFLSQQAVRIQENSLNKRYFESLESTDLVENFIAGKLKFVFAPVLMVSDNPAKGLNHASTDELVLVRLVEVINRSAESLNLVSAYFVPGNAGTDALVKLAKRGVEISILTNSLEATDVSMVHAGYAKHRQRLLQAGVRLFELRREPGTLNTATNAGKGFGSSGSSLHAKTFSSDSKSLFVGSFNFDPRSATLNTEIGFVIDSPESAQRLNAAFSKWVPFNAYEVKIGKNGNLYWTEKTASEEKRFDTEPNSNLFERMWISVLSVLPIDWLL